MSKKKWGEKWGGKRVVISFHELIKEMDGEYDAEAAGIGMEP